MSELIYLASPYSDDDQSVVEERFQAVCAAAGRFMAAGRYVYSPIAHTHPIAKVATLPTDWEFWRGFDEAVISRATELWVLTLDGWDESRGVRAEIEIARRYGVAIRMVAEDAEV